MNESSLEKTVKVTVKDLVAGRDVVSLVNTYSRIQMLEDACTFDVLCGGDRGSKIREEILRQEANLGALLADIDQAEEVHPYLATILQALNQDEVVCRNERADLLFDTVLGIVDEEEEEEEEDECTCGCCEDEEVDEGNEVDEEKEV